jgi:predicted nucleic acid-binding protein
LIVHLDTSVLVDALRPDGPRQESLRALVRAGDKPTASTIAIYEWLRGPRTEAEVGLREAVLPDQWLVAFGVKEAARAARIYQTLRRPRGREADIAVAACAIEHGAALWTLNIGDFKDIPELKLYR